MSVIYKALRAVESADGVQESTSHTVRRETSGRRRYPLTVMGLLALVLVAVLLMSGPERPLSPAGDIRPEAVSEAPLVSTLESNASRESAPAPDVAPATSEAPVPAPPATVAAVTAGVDPDRPAAVETPAMSTSPGRGPDSAGPGTESTIGVGAGNAVKPRHYVFNPAPAPGDTSSGSPGFGLNVADRQAATTGTATRTDVASPRPEPLMPVDPPAVLSDPVAASPAPVSGTPGNHAMTAAGYALTQPVSVESPGGASVATFAAAGPVETRPVEPGSEEAIAVAPPVAPERLPSQAVAVPEPVAAPVVRSSARAQPAVDVASAVPAPETATRSAPLPGPAVPASGASGTGAVSTPAPENELLDPVDQASVAVTAPVEPRAPGDASADPRPGDGDPVATRVTAGINAVSVIAARTQRVQLLGSKLNLAISTRDTAGVAATIRDMEDMLGADSSYVLKARAAADLAVGGDAEQARTLLRRVLDRDPADKEARINIAAAEIRLGETGQARRRLETLAREYPGDRKINNLLESIQ